MTQRRRVQPVGGWLISNGALLAAHECLDRMPPAASVAAAILADPLNEGESWRGRDPVRRAHEDILFATLAGIDHLHNYVAALRSNRDLTVSTKPTAVPCLGNRSVGRG